MKKGLLPLSQDASILSGMVGYVEYRGAPTNQMEKESLAQSLAAQNNVLFVRNQGVLVVGATIEEAWSYAETVMSACETQVIHNPCRMMTYKTSLLTHWCHLVRVVHKVFIHFSNM